jgi:hypothetical protein
VNKHAERCSEMDARYSKQRVRQTIVRAPGYHVQTRGLLGRASCRSSDGLTFAMRPTGLSYLPTRCPSASSTAGSWTQGACCDGKDLRLFPGKRKPCRPRGEEMEAISPLTTPPCNELQSLLQQIANHAFIPSTCCGNSWSLDLSKRLFVRICLFIAFFAQNS